MHRTLRALALCSVLAAPSLAGAQQLDLPRPSPLAKVSQVVGLTEVAVEYSSPAAKGRAIWGGLVPYDKLWRTGANAATKVTFGKDVKVGGQAVPAGSYSLFTIPGKDEWTVILNKNATASTGDYKQDLDQARVQVKPVAMAEARERLTFVFSGTTDDATSLDLEWEKLRVPVAIQTATAEQALANIKGLTDGAWRPWNSAARYMLEQKKDYDAGLALVDKSLALKEEWFNVWTKAQLLAAKGGKAKEARALAEKAQKLGEAGPPGSFFYADEVRKALAEWKAK